MHAAHLTQRCCYTPLRSVRYRRPIMTTSFKPGQTVIHKATGQHSATCFILHGLGDSGEGIGSLAPALRLQHVKYICPTAPTRPVSINMGMSMNAWFDIRGFGPGEQDKEGILAAVDYVSGLVDDEVAAGIPRDRIVLAGFSQGGHVAIKTALLLTQPLAAAVGLSTWCEKTAPVNEATKQMPLFLGHGSADPLVIPSLAIATTEGLKAVGMERVLFKMYPGLTHSTSNQELIDLRAFLLQHIPEKLPSMEEVDGFSVRQLREFLGASGVDTRSFFEKSEFLERARELVKKKTEYSS